jgi:two-component system, OmpR family, phosphate regulon response regulator PhoB
MDHGMTPRILLVEDDAELVAPVTRALREHGHEVTPVENGKDALADIARKRPDLVILELGLKDGDGKDILRRIRADARTADLPVIMISERGEEIDRVVAFEVGADDYVTRPFSTRELALRAAAVLRRANRGGKTNGTAVPPARGGGRLEIDVDAHRVRIEGRPVTLSLIEFRLLAFLARSVDHVQTRTTLLEHVWQDSDPGETRKVDTHVKRLRAKLGPVARYIETVRGVGYRLRRAAFDE